MTHCRKISFVLMIFLLGLSVLGARSSAAQTIAITDKQMCVYGSRPCVPTIAPLGVQQPVSFEIKIRNYSSTAVQAFHFTEDYPSGLILMDPINPVKCFDDSGNMPVPVQVVSAGPPLDLSVPLSGNQNLVCYMDAHFEPRARNATNTVYPTSDPNSKVTEQFSSSAALQVPSDLIITKTRIGSSGAVDVSSGPQTVRFQVEITTDQPVVGGSWMSVLDDILRYSNYNSIPFTVSAATLISCDMITTIGTQNNFCQLQSSSAVTPDMYSWKQLAKFVIPNNTNFVFAPGDRIIITYDVTLDKRQGVTCAKGSDGIKNAVSLQLSGSLGSISDTSSSNNSTRNQPVNIPVLTGLPTCGGGGGGGGGGYTPWYPEIKINKANITSPVPSNVWGSTQEFEITVTNPAGSGQTYTNLTVWDRFHTYIGVPQFDFQVVDATVFQCPTGRTCNRITPTNPPGPVTTASVNGGSYYLAKFTIDELAQGESAKMRVKLKLENPGCDYRPNRPKSVSNEAGVSFTYYDNSHPNVTRSRWVNKTISLDVSNNLDACNFTVSKTPLTSPAEIVFGQPFSYSIAITNNMPIFKTMPTIIDRMGIRDQYYTSLGLTTDHSYSCTGPVTVSGSKTNAKLRYHNVTASSMSGLHKGLEVMRLSNVNFPPGATLNCTVTVTIQQPDTSDTYCQSAGNPLVDNTILISDMPNFDENQTWPAGPQSEFWDTTTAELPKCFSLTVNKNKSTNNTTSNGPPVEFTITVNNTSQSGSAGNLSLPPGELIFVDQITAGTLSTVPVPTLTCPTSGSPSCTWISPPNISGAGSFRVDTLDVGDTLTLKYRFDPPFTSSRICNSITGTFTVNGAAPTRWYDKGSILSDGLCFDVFQSLHIRKSFSGIELNPAFNPNSATYTVLVSCTNQNGPPYQSTVTLSQANNFMADLNYMPIGSVCTVTEQPPTTPIPSDCQWLPALYKSGTNLPFTQTPAVVDLAGTSPRGDVVISNKLDCNKRPLTVVKEVRKANFLSPIPPGSSYDITVECVHPMWPLPQQYTVSFTQSGTQNLPTGLPLGAVCHATEVVSGTHPPHCGWDKNISGPITISADNAQNVITVTNTYSCGPVLPDLSSKFEVIKQIHPQSAPLKTILGPHVFPISVSCLGTTASPASFSLTPGAQQTVTVPAVGASASPCTVTETPPLTSNPFCKWHVDYSTNNGISWSPNPVAVHPANALSIGSTIPQVIVRNRLQCVSPAVKLDIVKEIGSGGCTDDPNLPGWNPATSHLCEFEVIIRNNGTAAFNGTLNFQDSWAASNTYIKSITPASVWSCSPMSPGGGGAVSCSAPGQSIPAGGSVTARFWLYGEAATMPSRNCASLTIAKEQKDDLNFGTRSTGNATSGSTGGGILTAPTSCIPLKQEPTGPVIEVSKICTPNPVVLKGSQASAQVTCKLSVTGAMLPPGQTVVLVDDLSTGTLAHVNAGTNPLVVCGQTASQQIQCELSADDLNAQGQISTELDMEVDDLWTQSEFKNCVHAEVPNGSGSTTSSQTACALARLRKEEHQEDPKVDFGLQKAALGDCRADIQTQTYHCPMGFELRNTGTADFTGPMVLTDRVIEGPSPIRVALVSGEGWSCPGVAQGVLSCLNGQLHLPAGKATRLSVDLTLPGLRKGGMYCNRLLYGVSEDPTQQTLVVQQVMTLMQIDAGPVDGKLGPQTKRGVRQLQDRLGLPLTGQIDGNLLDALGVSLLDTRKNAETCVELSPMPEPPLECDPQTAVKRGDICACRYKGMVKKNKASCACSGNAKLIPQKGCVEKIKRKPPHLDKPAVPVLCDPKTTVNRNGECMCRFKGMRRLSETHCG